MRPDSTPEVIKGWLLPATNIYWRPHGESNPGYRRERPFKSAFHPILLNYLCLKSRLGEVKAVKKAVT